MTWKQRIERARKAKRFTVEDQWLAGYYFSCAVGERLHIPSDVFIEENQPGHDEAMQFYHAVRANQIDEAERIYKRIQTLFPKKGATR